MNNTPLSAEVPVHITKLIESIMVEVESTRLLFKHISNCIKILPTTDTNSVILKDILLSLCNQPHPLEGLRLSLVRYIETIQLETSLQIFHSLKSYFDGYSMYLEKAQRRFDYEIKPLLASFKQQVVKNTSSENKSPSFEPNNILEKKEASNSDSVLKFETPSPILVIGSTRTSPSSYLFKRSSQFTIQNHYQQQHTDSPKVQLASGRSFLKSEKDKAQQQHIEDTQTHSNKDNTNDSNTNTNNKDNTDSHNASPENSNETLLLSSLPTLNLENIDEINSDNTTTSTPTTHSNRSHYSVALSHSPHELTENEEITDHFTPPNPV
eukprot:TRINITY_DN7959_c0_g1_i1.p1 TRINITY_DN7959_c0_g1~~TRINITY_DN7959_c0_g1_i1.p1  ORF type:complete len:358 (-),score=94.25 TRINITY_DN7959_c0_g1_i1:20-991(-)